MYNTACRIVGDKIEAEDVLQEAFISAFKNLKNYREEASFGSWLKKIVVNKALNSVQKNKKDLMLAENMEDDLEYVVEEESEPAYSVNEVKYAINKLPSGFKTVLSLYLFDGYDHKEISEILGISESTSKSQYKRAKDKLKNIIKKGANYG